MTNRFLLTKRLSLTYSVERPASPTGGYLNTDTIFTFGTDTDANTNAIARVTPGVVLDDAAQVRTGHHFHAADGKTRTRYFFDFNSIQITHLAFSNYYINFLDIKQNNYSHFKKAITRMDTGRKI